MADDIRGGVGSKEGADTPAGTTPTQSRPGSPEATPEAGTSPSSCHSSRDVTDHSLVAEPTRIVEPKVELIVDETPFVLADAATLGIPVFSKPIAPPKMVLTTFPKVRPPFSKGRQHVLELTLSGHTILHA